MQYREYGNQNSKVMILLHGGGLSQWNYRETAQLLQEEYRVILPILDGHGGSHCPFTTIEENAARIIRFIDEAFGGQVELLGGLSLGGQILLEILAQRPNICRRAVVESASVSPSRLTHAMIAPAFGSCYGLIRRKWFATLQFRSLQIQEVLFDDYFRDTCTITKESMIAFMQASTLYTLKPAIGQCAAKTHVFVGEKENRAMHRSAAQIAQALPNAQMQVLPGLYHGQFSLNHAADYAQMIRKAITDQ